MSETERDGEMGRRATNAGERFVGGTNQAESSSSGCRGAVWRREEEGAMMGRRVRGRVGRRIGHESPEDRRKRTREHDADGQPRVRSSVTPPRQVLRYL